MPTCCFGAELSQMSLVRESTGHTLTHVVGHECEMSGTQRLSRHYSLGLSVINE